VPQAIQRTRCWRPSGRAAVSSCRIAACSGHLRRAILGQILQEQRVRSSPEPDVQVRDVAFGERDDVRYAC
jgi:hypothetical protein